MMVLDLVLRWMHIVPAVVLVGGLAYQRLALVPPDQEGAGLAVAPAWSRAVMLSAAFLLLSGLINTARLAIGYDLPPIYNALLGVKLLLALIVFYLASRLAGRSEAAQAMRRDAKKWLNATLGAAVVLVLLASTMKTLDKPPKLADETIGENVAE